MAVALDIVTNPTSTPYRYGLFTTAPPADDTAFAPRGGDYAWRVQGCTPGAQWAYCWQDAYPTQDAKSVLPDAWMEASPFVVYDGVRCQRAGFPDGEQVARQRLTLSEQGQAERWLWQHMGEEAAASDGAILAAADAPFGSVDQAVAALEAQLAATTGAVGVIHMPRYAAALDWHGHDPHETPTQTLATVLGTPIVAGGGYSYTGPDGAATDDVLWVYATGPVTVRRGEVQYYGGDSGGFDQKSNEVWHIAERPYLITADCPVYAAAVTATGRPDTTWPTPPARFAMSVDASDPLNVTASFTGASCDTVAVTWGDGSANSHAPVTDGAATAAHNYETGTDPSPAAAPRKAAARTTRKKR
jgi:hypothetical protein